MIDASPIRIAQHKKVPENTAVVAVFSIKE
jgi:hypothetical protein